MGLNLQELSFTEPGSAGPKQPWFSGEHHFLVHSASLMKTYSSEENPSPRLQLRSNTQTRCSNYHRQNISTLGKMGIKWGFLKLHQPVQFPSSQSLPYKAVPALSHTPLSTKSFTFYFPPIKTNQILDSATWPAKAELCLSLLLLKPKENPKAWQCREAAAILNCLGLLDIYHSNLSYPILPPQETDWRTKQFIMISEMTGEQNLISQGRRLFLLQLLKKKKNQFGSFSTCLNRLLRKIMIIFSFQKHQHSFLRWTKPETIANGQDPVPLAQGHLNIQLWFSL